MFWVHTEKLVRCSTGKISAEILFFEKSMFMIGLKTLILCKIGTLNRSINYFSSSQTIYIPTYYVLSIFCLFGTLLPLPVIKMYQSNLKLRLMLQCNDFATPTTNHSRLCKIWIVPYFYRVQGEGGKEVYAPPNLQLPAIGLPLTWSFQPLHPKDLSV